MRRSAAEWLAIREDLADDPATVTIARVLDVDPRYVVGLLLEVWAWARRNSLDGTVDVPATWLDKRFRVEGLAGAMVRAGWLELAGDGIRFPRWDRWLSDGAKARRQASARAKRYRQRRAFRVLPDTASQAAEDGPHPPASSGRARGFG